MEQVVSAHGISQKRACQLVGQSRSSQRYRSTRLPDEDEITEQIVQLTRDDGRYGYRRITAMLRLKGDAINHKRVYTGVPVQPRGIPHSVGGREECSAANYAQARNAGIHLQR